jgi:hypothetical protein
MRRWAERVFAYGMPLDAGPIECVDCGHRLEHATRGPLPPCPCYRDSTHARAAWRPLWDDDSSAEDRMARSG